MTPYRDFPLIESENHASLNVCYFKVCVCVIDYSSELHKNPHNAFIITNVIDTF